MKTKIKLYSDMTTAIHGIFLVVFLLVMNPASAQTAAGKVVFAQGQPQAVNTQGTSRQLARGNEVFSGDRLITDSGRLQISMADGAFISVQPNSEYQIENYHYSGSPDGTEQANYRLDKGGVRAITGLIGRQNPEAYKVNTAVATIGIRGTGHNTRICQGDCSNREDGLYHFTWEGITYVVNDADLQDVPAGNGVYVEDIDTQILLLDQPPALVAIQRIREAREQEQEESEQEGRTVASGEQRDASGDQRVVRAARGDSVGSSTILPNFGVLGVLPDDESEDEVDIFSFEFDSILFRRDSDRQGIGFIGLESDESDDELSLATIDPAAVRGADNADVVLLAESLLARVGDELLARFEENPATSAEFFFNGEVGFGRWTGGNILVAHENDVPEVLSLDGFQSVHYMFGTEPPSIPTSGIANYNFFNGTRSTSASGASIGDGILKGLISVDFANSSGFLRMNVRHDSLDYLVNGMLFVDTADNSIVDGAQLGVTTTGGLCSQACRTFIDAGFTGPALAGLPKYLALEYDIQAPDVIMGVGLFGLGAPSPGPVRTDSIFVAVSPDMDNPGDAGITLGFDTSLFLDEEDKLVGALFTEDDDGFPLRVAATVDLDALLKGDDPASVFETQQLLTFANQGIVNDFLAATPATVADSVLNADGFGWGRWTDGSILVFDNSGGSEATELVQLVDNQSIHFIFGPDPGAMPTSGSASYEFAGGTRSSSVSGVSIGNGATSGFISVTFDDTGFINMTVDHIPGSAYIVSGALGFDGSGIFDLGATASTSAPGSACNSTCSAFIDGGFAVPGEGVNAPPGYIGIEYDIQDTDVVTGVAGFELDTGT